VGLQVGQARQSCGGAGARRSCSITGASTHSPGGMKWGHGPRSWWSLWGDQAGPVRSADAFRVLAWKVR